jgi:elongation factor Ts
MKITMEQVKKLRAQTQAGVMEAKKALEESGGEMKKAKTWLVKHGLDKAAKKADRETKEGLVEAYTHTDGKVAALVKLTCETDFVARTQEFKTLAHELAMQVASMDPKDVDELLRQDYIRDTSKTVGDLVKEAIAKLGENIQVIDFSVLRI